MVAVVPTTCCVDGRCVPLRAVRAGRDDDGLVSDDDDDECRRSDAALPAPATAARLGRVGSRAVSTAWLRRCQLERAASNRRELLHYFHLHVEHAKLR